MSFNVTSDDIVYSQTIQPENIAEKPFIQNHGLTQYLIPIHQQIIYLIK